MSFLGGPECSTGANPLAQFTKHVQDDKSLQRDRLMGRGGNGMAESMRSQQMGPGGDGMMDDFAQQRAQLPGMPAEAAWNMDKLHQSLPRQTSPEQRHWAAEFGPGMQGPQIQQRAGAGFSAGEFARFQNASPSVMERNQSPLAANQMMNNYTPSFAARYGGQMGMMGGMPSYAYQPQQQQQPQQSDKGKGRMVELDDSQWEEQFKALEQSDRDLDAEANAAINKELDGQDRQLAEDEMFQNVVGEEWSDFDNLGTHADTPALGDYLFEEENPFSQQIDAFAQGVEIMDSGGNLSLAALAFEAAVQKDPSHVEAWVRLGSAQAQNEKEIPAIRALEHALKLDPNNLEALMGLAVSYTNESYESSAYRTLERWISVKYPSLITQPLREDTHMGFTERIELHDHVTKLFIKAAQMHETGENMDPDVQVGLGVLFYAADDFTKSIDCFEAALASTEDGIVNQRQNLHLLWNRLGATLANSGSSEAAISAYEKALELRPNFVRARYNLGVSCINMGVLPEAAGHLLAALQMHRVDEVEGRQKAKELVEGSGGPAVSEVDIDRLITQNSSTNLYDTLRRVFTNLGRRDLSDKVGVGMQLSDFREFMV